MPHRPIIGVTTQTLHAIDGIPAGLPASVVMNQRYYSAVSDAGGAPVLVPLLDDDDALRAAYDACHGLLIPGGVDIDPASFGEAPHPKLGRIDPARDRVELKLARWAIADHKPLLGLCRGLQVINVALGGTLYQDLESQRPEGMKHDYFPIFGYGRDHLAHDVAVGEDTWLRKSFASDRVPVNSMHHQGIKTLAAALHPAAVAPDGLVEAAESRDGHFLVGVQWHPEALEPNDGHARSLFRAFVEQAARFQLSGS